MHFNKGAPKDNGKSAKVWVLSNGELQEEHRGIYSGSKDEAIFNKLMEIAYANIEKAKLLWIDKKEYIEYLDIVGKFNIKQND